jgi:hypothetical protein
MLKHLVKKSLLLIIPALLAANARARPVADTALNYPGVAQKLLYATRTGNDVLVCELQLQQADENILRQQLSDDNKIKAFWLNIYNAYIQILLTKNPESYKKRGQFFDTKIIAVAGQMLSLDDIEHGILRRSKLKWSLGYFNKWIPNRFEKKFRVRKVDYRIHFALNCGAKSCPPIAFYDDLKIDTQLRQATKSYLRGEAHYEPEKNIVYLPAIMSWFRRDFGGKKQMLALLREMQIIPAEASLSIKFKEYDWELFLSNYSKEED